MGNSRLLRLEEKVMDYNYTVHYIQGQENMFADICSRHPMASEEAQDMPRTISLTVKRIVTGGLSTPHNDQKDVEQVVVAGLGDKEYSDLVSALRNKKHVKDLPSTHPARKLASEYSSFQVEETSVGPLITYHCDRLFIPRC